MLRTQTCVVDNTESVRVRLGGSLEEGGQKVLSENKVVENSREVKGCSKLEV